MELFPLGKLGAPFGVRGEMKLYTHSGESEHLAALDWVEARNSVTKIRLAVESIRSIASCAIVKFKDVDSPEVAKGYVNYEVWADKAFFCPKREGEYYVDELVGVALVTKSGERKGEVIAVVKAGQDDMLEVRTVAGATCLVPFRKEFVGEIDLAARAAVLLEDWIVE